MIKLCSTNCFQKQSQYQKMDIKQDLCQACLSNDRKLHPLKSLQTILEELNVWEMRMNDNIGGVCWECRNIIIRFFAFRTRARRAQQLLGQSNEFHRTDSLTSLSHTVNNGYNYEFIYKTDEIESTLAIIKEEIDTEVNNENHEEKSKFFLELEQVETSDIEEHFDHEVKPCDIFADTHEMDYSFEDHETKPLEKELFTGTAKTLKIKNKKTRKLPKRSVTSKLKKVSALVPKGELVRKSSRLRKTDIEHINTEDIESETTKDIEKEEEEINEKFTIISFTEEDMLRSREEKRSHPNFKKIPFKCDSCVTGFLKKDTYDAHVMMKHSDRTGDYPCPVCQIRFQTCFQEARHRRKHYASYRCRLCKYETAERWAALGHCRLKHGADARGRIHCARCDAVAKTPEELTQHMRAAHASPCAECGQQFRNLSSLKSHLRRVHNSGVKREFICDVCNKTFKTRSRMESHMVSHDAAIAQSLAYCAACDVQYKNLYVYRNHLRTSANHADQLHQCRVCKKKFASKTYWKKHYDFYHLRKSEWNCEICGKLFISEWRLKSHRQTQHGVDRAREHRCAQCGKQFYTHSTLKCHLLTHSEQRSFMCEECGDTFKQRPSLYTHYKLVHKGVRRKRNV